MADIDLDDLERLAKAVIGGSEPSKLGMWHRLTPEKLLALIERVRRAESTLHPERPDHEGDPAESVHCPPLRGEPPQHGVWIGSRFYPGAPTESQDQRPKRE